MEKRKRRTFTENNTQKKNKAEKRKERNVMKKTFALLCFLCAFIMNVTAQTWVGTWATAPQAAEKSKVLYSNTPHSIRQVVKVSLGGEVIRLKLSNIYSSEPVVIRSVYIAHAKDSFGVDAKSAEYLKFSRTWSALPSPSTTPRLPKFQPYTWARAPPPIS